MGSTPDFKAEVWGSDKENWPIVADRPRQHAEDQLTEGSEVRKGVWSDAGDIELQAI